MQVPDIALPLSQPDNSEKLIAETSGLQPCFYMQGVHQGVPIFLASLSSPLWYSGQKWLYPAMSEKQQEDLRAVTRLTRQTIARMDRNALERKPIWELHYVLDPPVESNETGLPLATPCTAGGIRTPERPKACLMQFL